MMPRRIARIVLLATAVLSLSGADFRGLTMRHPIGGRAWPFLASGRLVASNMAREIRRRNLRLLRVEEDVLAGMEHRRYGQFHRGLEVVGGQVVQHLGRGRTVSYSGRLYPKIAVDPGPALSADAAVEVLRESLGEPCVDRSNGEPPGLVIYPVTDGDCRLAYRVRLRRGPAEGVTGYVDARSGDVLRIVPEERMAGPTIGLGFGVHGGLFKLATSLADGIFWLADYRSTRPVNQITRDFAASDVVASDTDNVWDHDGALVSVHAYAGWVYDYFFAVLGRSGYDGADENDIVSHVHYPTSGIAIYSAGQIYFDTPAAGALDLVGHEYAHGVTANSSGLMYYCDADAQPGALDEAFADIVGAAVEFYWQDPGLGFDLADWLIGEDVDPPYAGNPYYGAPAHMRDLADPNSTFFTYQGVAYPYPCHLSQCRVFLDPVSDWGGVHFNSTLYSHAFHLVAAGGANRVSGLGVTGIGLDDAVKIFYRAWTHYLTPRADYSAAANALLLSATDLFGAASAQRAQTARALEAIGVLD